MLPSSIISFFHVPSSSSTKPQSLSLQSFHCIPLSLPIVQSSWFVSQTQSPFPHQIILPTGVLWANPSSLKVLLQLPVAMSPCLIGHSVCAAPLSWTPEDKTATNFQVSLQELRLSLASLCCFSTEYLDCIEKYLFSSVSRRTGRVLFCITGPLKTTYIM